MSSYQKIYLGFYGLQGCLLLYISWPRRRIGFIQSSEYDFSKPIRLLDPLLKPSITLQHSKAANAGTLLSEDNEPSNSNDESGLSDSDSDLSSNNDAYSSKEKQDSSTRMNIPWEPVDEQRLLAYKKEDKSWEWIFKKLPGRTPAVVRTRWTMVQHRVK